MWVVNKHYASFGTKNCIYTRFGFRNRTTVEIEQLSSDFQVIHSDKFNHSFHFTYLQWDDEALDPENGLINIARELEEHFTRIKQTDFAGKRPTENIEDFSIELNGYTLAITLRRSFVIRDSDQAQQEVILTNFLWENAQKTDRYNVILNFPKIEVINECFEKVK